MVCERPNHRSDVALDIPVRVMPGQFRVRGALGLATEVAPKSLVDLVASADGDDQDQQLAVVDLTANPVVAHPDPPDAGVAFERFTAMRPRGITKAVDGNFDRIGVGRLLFVQLVQELISGPKDLNRVGHSSGLSAGTPNERHTLLVAGLKAGQRCTHGLFIKKVLQLLKQLGRGGGHHGRRTVAVLGQRGKALVQSTP